jgi:hypothetical protein
MESKQGETSMGTSERREESPKRVYSAPEVRALGSVRELTLTTASGAIADNPAGTPFKVTA